VQALSAALTVLAAAPDRAPELQHWLRQPARSNTSAHSRYSYFSYVQRVLHLPHSSPSCSDQSRSTGTEDILWTRLLDCFKGLIFYEHSGCAKCMYSGTRAAFWRDGLNKAKHSCRSDMERSQQRVCRPGGALQTIQRAILLRAAMQARSLPSRGWLKQ